MGGVKRKRKVQKSRKKYLHLWKKCDIMGEVKQVAFATSTNSEESEE